MTGLKVVDNADKGRVVNVAIAVIHYGNQYLLGFRHAKQHQGNRYEFIGGKIESEETPQQALVREVKEEIGLILTDKNTINPLGILKHDYSTKQNALSHNNNNQSKPSVTSKIITLHVYRVGLTHSQYLRFSSKQLGLEGQKIEWVHFDDLIANKYQLPDANATILQWLGLADAITITYNVFNKAVLKHLTLQLPITCDEHDSKKIVSADYQNQILDNGICIEHSSQVNKDEISHYLSNWLDFHSNVLHQNASVYVRTKDIDKAEECHLIMALLQKRTDLKLIINSEVADLLSKAINDFRAPSLIDRIAAQHITQSMLDKLFSSKSDVKENSDYKLSEKFPITISCHDVEHIRMANELAQFRQQHKLPPVIGIFISPVKTTSTHPEAKALGWTHFNYLSQIAQVPVIALGGLAPKELFEVRNNGGDKIAGISQFIK